MSTSRDLSHATADIINEETPLLHTITQQTSISPIWQPTKADPSIEQRIDPPDDDERFWTPKLYFILIGLYFGVFIGALDSTIIATLSTPIASTFNSLSLLSWLLSAYLIANAACAPLSGRLTDIFGRREGLMVCNILFGAGNLLCGVAWNEWSMIAGRAVAGMGGGGLMSISAFVVSDLVPLRKRGMVQGIGNIAYGLGASLGGTFGGAMNDSLGWRYAFLSQVPLVMMSGAIVFSTVKVPRDHKPGVSKLARIDFLGAFTLVTTLLLLLMGLSLGGNIVPWSNPWLFSSFVLSFISLLAFIHIEINVASEPFIPIKLLVNPTILAACICCWFSTMVAYICLFYIPIFFQVKGYTTTNSGMHIIPQSIGIAIGGLAAGVWTSHTGRYQSASYIFLSFIILGSGLLVTLTFGDIAWPELIYLFLVGSGYGGTLVVTLLAAIASERHEYHAVITSMTYAFRYLGSTIGVNIASAVFQNVLAAGLGRRFSDFPDSKDIIKKIRDDFDEINHLPSSWRQGVVDSYLESVRWVFVTSCLLAVCAAVAGGFLRQHVLHKTLARTGSK